MARQRSLFEVKIHSQNQQKISKSTQAIVPEGSWNILKRLSDSNSPQPWVPIEFNTGNKKPVRGYRLRNGFVTDTPYFINLFLKEHGTIEWRPILSCTDVNKCPRGFPNCDYCNIHKKSKKEL